MRPRISERIALYVGMPSAIMIIIAAIIFSFILVDEVRGKFIKDVKIDIEFAEEVIRQHLEYEKTLYEVNSDTSLSVISRITKHRILECSVISLSVKPVYVKSTNSDMEGEIVKDKNILRIIKKAKKRTAYMWPEQAEGMENSIYIASPVEGMENTMIFMRISSARLEKRINIIIFSIVATAVVIALFIIVASLFVSNKTLLPLKKLTLMVEKFNRDKNVGVLDIKADDEIGILSSALNDMIGNLESVKKELSRGREEAESQSKFSEAVLQNVANGIIVVDSNGRITNINNAIESNTGLSKERLVGKAFQEVFASWEGEKTGDILTGILKSGESYTNDRVRYKAPTMERHVVFNVRIKPIIEKKGAILGAVVLFEFLTDKVLLEEHLLKVNEDLQRANIVKSEFLSMVSHELRTPLTLIKMYSAMLAEKKIGPLNEKQEKAVDVLNRRCKNLNDLIDDLLDLSRVESGKMEANLEKVFLDDLIRDAVAVYKVRAEVKGLFMEVVAHKKIPAVFADRDKISRVINNLLENALKFTNQGGITIYLDKYSSSAAILSVTDTGMGVPDQYKESIFDKFFQVDGTDTREHGGSGLGLAIARELISLHGGKLWLDSSGVNRGSAFCFTLPFYDSDLAGSKHLISGHPSAQDDGKSEIEKETKKRKEKAASGEMPTMLLVDDDLDFLEMMRDTLIQDNFTVYTAHHGIEAINILFSDKKIDIVLLDITMPKASGYEICKAMKLFEATKEIPVLMLTAAGQTEQISKGYTAGASGYLVKPFRLEILKRTIFRILEEK